MLCISARCNDQLLRWPIPRGEARIGAAPTNDFVARLPGVSRVHAVLTPVDGGVRIVDYGSKNGIVADGRRVQEIVLREGMFVQIGRATLTLEDARTSDVEIDLRIRSDVNEAAFGETAEASSSECPDAESALRVMRRIESGGRKFSGRRRQKVLEEVRQAAGAQSLILGTTGSDGEVTILAAAGDVPPDITIRGRRRPSRAKTQWKETRKEGVRDVVVIGVGRRHLLAMFAGSRMPWSDDFLAVIAEKLLRGGDAPDADAEGDGAPLLDEERLAIPAGMVIGPSPAMRRLLDQIAATVRSHLDVLLLGETGTGKEVFARMIHASGPSPEGPFVAVNCAAIPGELLEAELFGVHGRVATGVDPRPGLFVQAHRGSILLDEIAELPDRLQAKLLRVLQEREVLPLGAAKPRKIDVRVISASNRDLPALVREGRFRSDLYYRLRGLQFHIPPLRDRKEDIPALVLEFVARAAAEYAKAVEGVTRSALRVLVEHDWPGNVRELESEIRRAVLVCPRGGSLQREHLGTVRWLVDREESQPGAHRLRDEIDDLERQRVDSALRSTGGNRTMAAKLLGITRNGLALKMKRLGLHLRAKQ